MPTSLPPPPPTRYGRALLLGAAALVAGVWQLPYGPTILYPFTLLATFVHEMGHGLTALALGATLESFTIHADGSGLAAWSGQVGRLGRALVAAGGLLGPSIAGAGMVASARWPRLGRPIVYGLAAFMLASALVWGSGAFTWGFLVVGGAALAGLARLLPPTGALFLAQLLGVVLALSWFRDLSYMFSPGAVVDGVAHASDSAQIADALLLPYWIWGALVAATSAVLLASALRFALARPSSPI